ncbi:MAG: hypothetical protein HY703_14125 [Gemmatimonadetes bacterium]|nr:hypothetical protein [Gemmatimonadota bacterium]
MSRYRGANRPVDANSRGDVRTPAHSASPVQDAAEATCVPPSGQGRNSLRGVALLDHYAACCRCAAGRFAPAGRDVSSREWCNSPGGRGRNHHCDTGLRAGAARPAPCLRSYAIEGHVPADLIRRLLDERPAIAGLAVPPMPLGAPGMEQGGQREPYLVVAFYRTGKTRVYARR